MEKERGYCILEKSSEFLKFRYDFLRAKGFVSQDGEYVSLSVYDVFVYLYVKQKIEYFAKEKGGEYFATQEQIANECGVSLSTVKRALKKFVDGGVLTCYKKKWRNYENWRYVDMKELTLYGEGVESHKETPTKHTDEHTDKEHPSFTDWLDNFDGIDPPY